MECNMKNFDVVVVGGGHAGVEAAFSSAKMGCKTALITLNKKKISNMPCNPSIGGSAKGIVVREIDALGGLMGIAADNHYLQMKMLNTGKGPGVRCLRTQQDKYLYPKFVQDYLEKTDNLEIIEAMVTSILHEGNKITGVIINNEEQLNCKAVVLSTGTYMESQILRGFEKYISGPEEEKSSLGLSASLLSMGLELFRLKTGTPPRLDKSSIDFSKTIVQDGMDDFLSFSYTTTKFRSVEEQTPCYLIYTNENTHELIRNNLNESAQFNGMVNGVGPRYCPSIEGKVMTFSDKPRHQLFLEPEYEDGDSIYLQGFATSMSKQMQEKLVKTLPGLENAKITKYAYAIEYDCLVPTQFDLSLKIKSYNGLYGAGQICGTSGYEEAGGLGIVAGINAALYVLGKEPFILRRNESYIGVMIDDLTTKGTLEPYRLLSSRAEYRLLLRHDNADMRLTKYGYELGLIDEERYSKFLEKNYNVDRAIQVLKQTYYGTSKEVSTYMISIGFSPLTSGVSGIDLLKRPGIKYEHLVALTPQLKDIFLDHIGVMQIETTIKYEGYIKKQEIEAASFSKFENYKLDPETDYMKLDGIRIEARQKLNKIKPLTIGQAGRISGVNPSDITTLILLTKRSKK